MALRSGHTREGVQAAPLVAATWRTVADWFTVMLCAQAQAAPAAIIEQAQRARRLLGSRTWWHFGLGAHAEAFKVEAASLEEGG